MSVLYLSIRVVHVLLAAVWTGAAILVLLYLEPTVRSLGPVGGQVMAGMDKRGYGRFIGLVGLITVLSGLWLMWTLSGHFSSGFMGSRSGMLLSTGMLTGILAWGAGAHMVARTVDRLTKLGQSIAATGAPPTADDQAQIARLQGKLRLGLRIVSTLLVITLVTMALGPHV